MTDRRTKVLDAAIETLGANGVRGLTHRAVDRAAALPEGSTVNLFGSRDALLGGIVERFAEVERAGFEAIALADPPLTPTDLARTLARFAIGSAGANRTVTLARYSLLVEGAVNEKLQRKLADTGSVVNDWATQWFRMAGSQNASRDWDYLANFITGLVLHELSHPGGAFDPTERIAELIAILMEDS